MKSIYILLFLGVVCLEIKAQSVFAPCTDGTQATCNCSSAPVLCSIDELDGAVLQMAGYQHPNDAPNPLCPGTAGVPNNPSWMAFTAWCEDLELEFVLSNCAQRRFNFTWSNGVQVAAYSACGPPNNGYRNIGCLVDSDAYCCSGFNCRPPNNLRMNLQNLTIGATYYLLVDGCGGARCDVRIDVVGECGREQIQEWPAAVTGPDTVCFDLNSVNYSIIEPQPNLNYHWTVNGNSVRSDSLPGIEIVFPQIGTYEVCVDASKPPCVPESASPLAICKKVEVVSVVPENPLPFQVCTGDSLFYEGKYYLPGTYNVNLLSNQGCDSAVLLSIEEIPAVSVDLGIVELCGDTIFRIGNEVFEESGVYSVTLQTLSAPFCDSLIWFEIKRRFVPAVSDGVINCFEPTIIPEVFLQGSRDNLIFNWLDSMGNLFNVGLESRFTIGGFYRLQVSDSANTCVLFSDLFEIKVDTVSPSLMIESPLGDTITCLNPLLPFNLLVKDGVKYYWDIDNQNYTGQSVEISKPGVAKVVVQDTLNGCLDSTFINIYENRELPTFSVIGDLEIKCGIDSICRELLIANDTENLSIIWENDKGENIGQDVKIVCIDSAGSYTLSVRDSRNGCLALEFFQVTDNRVYPVIEFSGDLILDCKSDSLPVSVAISNVDELSRFMWEDPLGRMREAVLGDSIWASEPGLYRITVTNADNNCVAVDSFLVGLDVELPDIENWKAIDALCDGSKGRLHYVGQVSLNDFRYFLEGQEVFAEELDDLTSGIYNFSVMGSNGCLSDTIIEIGQPGLWTLNLDTFALIELGDPIQLNPITDLEENQRFSLIWEPNEYVSCDTCLETTAFPVRSEIFKVTIVDSFGCLKTAEIRIQVKSGVPVFIPNAFSPNGDGINDIFSVYSKRDVVAYFDMKVFDRWGGEVFNGSLLQGEGEDGWDGKYRDINLDQGVYFYQVRVVLISGDELLISGEIQILKAAY